MRILIASDLHFEFHRGRGKTLTDELNAAFRSDLVVEI